MSAYINCPKCGEDTLDVDTLMCECGYGTPADEKGPIQIVFDGPPSHESGRFVEVEQDGKSIKFGEWKERGGEAGYTSKKLKIDKDEGESKDLPDAIPSTWLDPLLTGPDSIGPPPYNCKDIERLLNGLRERLKAKLKSAEAVVVTAGNVNEHFKHIVGATEEISQFGAELLLELRTALSAHDKDKQEPKEKHFVEEGLMDA